MVVTPLLIGDPAPWFTQKCTTPSGLYSFDMAAGRHIVLFFFDSSSAPGVAQALATIRERRATFDGAHCLFFGVTRDGDDEAQARLKGDLPGIRFFFDADNAASTLFGVPSGSACHWFIVDPRMRIRASCTDMPGRVGEILDLAEGLVRTAAHRSSPVIPAVFLDGVFEAEFCERLIAYYLQQDVRRSGVFTQGGDGQSIAVTDLGFKRRHDCSIKDRHLREQIQARIIRRVVPEIHKVFQFHATGLDRLILASYDAAERGCFGPHRDNTVKAAAHRRFAVSINLNDDFEGGNLIFPEFGDTALRPPTGGALIFSCSLLHAVTPVTRGRRFACLPFVYDDAAAIIKRQNQVVPG